MTSLMAWLCIVLIYQVKLVNPRSISLLGKHCLVNRNWCSLQVYAGQCLFRTMYKSLFSVDEGVLTLEWGVLKRSRLYLIIKK